MDMTKEGPVQGMVKLEIKTTNMKQKELSKTENRKDMLKKNENAKLVERLHKNAKKSEALRTVVVAGVVMSKKEKREKELIMNRIEDLFDKGVDKVNRKSKRKVFSLEGGVGEKC